MQSLKVCTKSLTEDLHLKASKREKRLPNLKEETSTPRQIGRTAHLLKGGKRKGKNSTSPVGNPITKSLLVKPLISPVIYFISFLTSFITFEPDIITVKLFINSHEYNPSLSVVKRKSKTRERSVVRNRYREQP